MAAPRMNRGISPFDSPGSNEPGTLPEVSGPEGRFGVPGFALDLFLHSGRHILERGPIVELITPIREDSGAAMRPAPRAARRNASSDRPIRARLAGMDDHRFRIERLGPGPGWLPLPFVSTSARRSNLVTVTSGDRFRNSGRPHVFHEYRAGRRSDASSKRDCCAYGWACP